MNIIRRFPMVAFAMALLAIAGFCVASESFGLLVVAGALAATSWYCTEGPRGRTLPRWVSNVLLLGAVLWALVEWFRKPDPSELMGLVGRFTLGLTIIKLYEPKGIRDYAQLLALTAVLTTAGALQSVQFGFALLLVAYVVVGLVAVVMFQLHIGYERAQATRRGLSPDDRRLVPPLLPVSGRHPVRGLAGLCTTMLAATFLLSAAIFVVFPRGLLARDGEGGAGQATSGFADEIRLRESVRISESRREVFTVRVLDPAGQAVRLPEPLRLRGAVLDAYNPLRGRWTSSRSSRAERRYRRTAGPDVFVPLTDRTLDDRVQTFTLSVTMRSMATSVVFSAYAPIAVAAAMDREVIFEPGTLLLRAPTEVGGALDRYQVRVQPFASQETMRSLSGDAVPAPRTANFPLVSVRREAVRMLAGRGIDADAPEPADAQERWRRRIAIARAISDELRSGAFAYTTDLSGFVVRDGDDPIVAFLTEYRAGHCELFASAMAALCRSVGVEARLITGFIAIEHDEAAKHYVVRESNAHAWVEVRSGPYTWATFDPTPAEDLIAFNEARRSWVDRWRWIYDRVEFMWNNRFVGFDHAKQATLAEGVASRWTERGREALEWTREAAASLNAAFRLGPAGYIWLGMVGLVGVVALVASVTVVRRRAAIRRVASLDSLPRRAAQRLLRELGFYADTLDVLHRGGIRKPEWETPLRFADRLAAERPELAEPVRTLVGTFYRVRFGGATLDAESGASVRRTLGELAQRLDVRAP
ncbi:MAG TPA: DUF3488 and transglutaminase-like domain-containing protein [Phycisphaerales bacterium]|nr:DUF3488 and transglutaminase-like domain-containing protein [Phycisphaerales bacterium]HMP36146.1 DUF3488 and transglutaminase-like domain-containing protein [Phycisphaerales bacterium]